MGNKAGYAEVILAALGLRSGEGAGAYVWAESDPDVRALLRAYPDPDMLRRIADIIRGWKDEEPRALWERLRAERKARGVTVDSDIAGWVVDSSWGNGMTPGVTVGWTGGYKGPGSKDDHIHIPATLDSQADRCHRLAEYAIAGAWAYRRGVPESGFNAGLLEDREPTETGGHAAKARTCEQEAGGFERVAGWITEHAGTHPGGGDFRGLHIHRPNVDGFIPGRGALADGCTRLASRWPPVAVLATLPTAAELSALLGTPGDLEGVITYMDPPYLGTTGYADDLPRADVVRLALDYHAAGAVVCISEAEPVIDGWHAIDIQGGRKGQKRTFSKQQREVLTMNREPAHRVATQERLFGATP